MRSNFPSQLYIEVKPKGLIITPSSCFVNSCGTKGHMTLAPPTQTPPTKSLYKDSKRKRNIYVSEVLSLLASLSQTPALESRVVLLGGGARRPAL